MLIPSSTRADLPKSGFVHSGAIVKIADTPAALRFNASSSRSPTSSSDESFPHNTQFAQLGVMASEPAGPSFHTLSSILSTMRLNAAEMTQTEKAKARGQAIEAEFRLWTDMTPTEKIRALALEERGLTETILQALPANERAQIENDVQGAIKRGFGSNAQTGGQAQQAAILKLV